ncbi:MAG: mandelate racemase/muconate lactonizing enzyme family protein [Devosia nanyangense]|uniref:glucarate dehydratase n=1 Tax=Devosia nanyangense TaxID=1228055 RepID=A0A933KZJ8_9HYPH|nr:mandelate racemase/muconate lactonizing enzyme family protein [Devosia nanyangense]
MLVSKGRAGWTVQFDELSKLMLRMELADGTVGLGEFYRDANLERVRQIAGGLLGQSLLDLPLQALPIPLCREYDGFECAIWDAFAKSADVPLHALLGGAVRDKVYIGGWSSHRGAEEMGQVARKFQEQGYDSIKIKSDLEDDVVGICAEIARCAPGIKVMIDPNQRWENVAATKLRLRGLEAVGNCVVLEDPIPRWMWQDYVELRRMTSIPIVLHISLPYVEMGQRPHDAINAIQHNSVDGFNFNAGLAKYRQLDAIASTANLFSWHGSEADLGILEAMYVHQAAAAQSCVWPSDIVGPIIRSSDLLVESLRFEPPFVHLPMGPGLGVELSLDAVEKHRIAQHIVA